jgi:hypothetical protein
MISAARSLAAPLRAARSIRARAPAARTAVVVSASAETRPLWYPGSDAPAHLTGTLPGDYGFDPLKLGADAENLKWFRQAELQNGRWAMLAVPGCLVPEVLTKAGVAELPIWSEAGKEKYFADPVTLTLVMFILFNFVEVRRYRDMMNPGSMNEDPFHKDVNGAPYKIEGKEVGYPGGRIFDPFGMASTPEAFQANKVKEIKNARLAMVAMAGFFVQAFVTGEGPVQNLLDHIADPGHVNFFSS